MTLNEPVPIRSFADLGKCVGAFDEAAEGFAFEGFAEMTIEGRTVFLNITLAHDMGRCTEAAPCGCPVCPKCCGIPF